MMHSAAYKNRHLFFQFILVVTKHIKYKIIAPTENSMALKMKKWPHIVSTSGAIVPTPSFTFLGPVNLCASEAAVPGVAYYNDRKHCRNGATFIQ